MNVGFYSREICTMKPFIPEYASRDLVRAAAISVGIGGGYAAGMLSYNDWIRKTKSKEASFLTSFAAGSACAISGLAAGMFAPEIVLVGAVTYCGYEMFKEVTGPNHANLV